MKIASKISPTKCSSKISRPKRTNFTSLPNEILEHILSFCSPMQRNCFRHVCQQFRDVHRKFIVHYYKVVCKRIRMKSSLQRRNSIASVLRVLYGVNWSFLQFFDMQVSFYAGAIELFESLHSAVMSSDVIGVLNKFHEDCEQMLSEHSFNVSYTISLLTLLNRFSTVSKSSQRIGSARIHFKYIVHNIWYVIIWSNGGRTLNHPKESRTILIMLTILLINEKFNRKFYEITESEGRTMIYGCTTARPVCCVTIEMDIFGDVDIIDYFAKNEICEHVSHRRMPSKGSNLTAVNILMKCKEASRLDGGQSYSICFWYLRFGFVFDLFHHRHSNKIRINWGLSYLWTHFALILSSGSGSIG